MQFPILTLILTLTTLVPITAQVQRTVDPANLPNPQQLPKDIRFATTISGTITPENPAQIAKEFSNLKCQDLQVVLEDNSLSPGSVFSVLTKATGKQLSSGCDFSLVVPNGYSGYIGRIRLVPHYSQKWSLQAKPQGWQNPLPLPKQNEKGRNFILYLEPFIK
ncbi:MAG: hypothetical protein NZ821_04445 [Gloeomargarita sp. SKYB31]|nr:hypothetical protein [Gloeomargarita sp. SKYB31]